MRENDDALRFAYYGRDITRCLDRIHVRDMMSNTYKQAFDLVLGNEGGYSNDKDDPGGETYKGIARNRWPNWGGWEYIDFIKTSTKDPEKAFAFHGGLQTAIEKFYREHFWNVVWGDELDKLYPLLAIDVFDMAVNLGTGRAIEFIQRACNALNNNQKLYPDILIDGSFGNRTLITVQKCVQIRGAELLYKVVNILQGAWYVSLMERNLIYEKYVGWFKRVDFIR